MRDYASFPKIYLHRDYIDMRKSINGLSQIVAEELHLNPCHGGLFVFTNRARSLLKCLYWDKTGFALWIKRLEKERFRWPSKLEGGVISLTPEQMGWLLAGLDVVKLQPHQALEYQAFS